MEKIKKIKKVLSCPVIGLIFANSGPHERALIWFKSIIFLSKSIIAPLFKIHSPFLYDKVFCG